MKIKKLLALVLAGAMTATLLVGCGGKDTTEPAADTAATTDDTAATDTAAADDTAATDTAATDDAAASGEKVKISIYRASFNVGSPDGAQVQKIQDAINEYIADKINVEVAITDIPSG